jgi:hypothetical protein
VTFNSECRGCIWILYAALSKNSSKTYKRRTECDNEQGGRGGRCNCKVIFGYHLSDGEAVFRADSTFESWRHWCKASKRFMSRSRSRSDNRDDSQTGENEHENCFLNGPYFLRAWKLWQKILHWCVSNDSGSYGHKLLASLQDGVTRYEGVLQIAKTEMLFIPLKPFSHLLEVRLR